MAQTLNNFSPNKKRNTQSTFGATGKFLAHLPSLNSTGGRFFATKQGSDSVGEKEDPIQARRLKLSQVAQKEGADKDKEFANMLYGTRHNT